MTNDKNTLPRTVVVFVLTTLVGPVGAKLRFHDI